MADHKSNNNDEPHGAAFVDEKSVHDRVLCLLAGMALVSLCGLGLYWQSLPLPPVQPEGETLEK